jgi:nicotinamidase/pyrazinamidase
MEPNKDALLVVDIQPDFMRGGALEVGDAEAIVPPVRALMQSDRFYRVVATQDWHPPGHISFASSHPGRVPFQTMTLYGHEQVLWPDHCVQGTPGGELSPDLPWQRVSAIIRKGSDPKVDSYSGFRNNWNEFGERPATGLGGYLSELGIRRVYVCGLARDYCVKWTAEDAAELGFDTSVFWGLTRAVDPGSDDAVRAAFSARGIKIVDPER